MRLVNHVSALRDDPAEPIYLIILNEEHLCILHRSIQTKVLEIITDISSIKLDTIGSKNEGKR